MYKPENACCGTAACPREEVHRLAGSGELSSDSIDQAARLVAAVCSAASPDTLRGCFETIFSLPAQCILGNRFVATFAAEREAMAQVGASKGAELRAGA